MTVYESLLRRAAQNPDGAALWLRVRGQTKTVTHAELVAGARRYQAILQRRGVRGGDIVLILLDHSVDQYWAFLGAMLMGAIPSFMPPLTAKQQPDLYWTAHATLFERILPRALVTGADRANQIAKHLPSLTVPVVTPEDATILAVDAPAKAELDAVALLQHSSGTTHLKKGVQLSHRAILTQVDSYASAIGLRADDRIATWLPLYHDMGLIACFMLPLIRGVPVIALDPFEWVARPDLLLATIAEHQCTLTWMPNFAFNHLLRTRRPGTSYALGSMRAWIDCSEPCRADTFDRFAAGFADCGVRPEHLQVCYAMAETVFAISQTRLAAPVSRLRVDPRALREERRVDVPATPDAGIELLSAGRVLPDLQISICGDDGEELQPGRVGTIRVSGAFLFTGYYGLPELTASRLIDGVYRTGDEGFVWQDELYVTGRVDDLMIINGRNFYAHEIEAVVSEVPGVKPGRVAAFATDDTDAGTQAPILVAESATEDSAPAPIIRAIRAAVLAQCDLMLRDVVLTPPGGIIKTTSGKVSRRENRARYLSAKMDSDAR